MKRDDYFDDSVDPSLGLTLSYGTLSCPCPGCGHVNQQEITAPANRFRFECESCGDEYGMTFTLWPLQ